MSPTNNPTLSKMYTFPPATGKTTLITGGSSGIGLATARALAAAGWNTLITGRTAETLHEACELIRQESHANGHDTQHIYSVGDVSSEADVSEAFAMASEHFGRVDLLFANAGTGAPPKPIDELELSEWKAVVDTNLTGTFLCAREAFCIMKKQGGGRIILNGSISAIVPRPNSAPCEQNVRSLSGCRSNELRVMLMGQIFADTSTKHAITGLTKSLSLDGRAHNIAVSQIDIGNASTPMTSRMESGPGVPQADGSLRNEPTFNARHAADQIVHMASLPLEVNIQFVTIAATTMPSFIGRG